MGLTRRYFLKSAGISLFGVGFVPSFMRRTAFALDQPGASARKKLLVAIFQRGAADGLNIVVPFGEPDYFSMRPTIAIPAPTNSSAANGDGKQAAIDLDGFFGFHPSLAALKPLFDAKHLAVIHAAGSPDNSRSHFDAQDYMESGTPGVKSTSDGWLNRYLQVQLEADATPFRSVAIAPRLPKTLMGPVPSFSAQDLRGFRFQGPANPHMPNVEGVFEAMYASASDPLLRSTAREMFEAVGTIQRMDVDHYRPSNGVEYPRSPLGNSLRQIAELIKADVGMEVAFAEVGGWDNHVNEGGAQGQLAGRLTDFADSLSAFNNDLGDRMADVCLLTMTEFGRTARENGNRGTDHGHASVMFALGGPVKGGKVYGKWPGLKSEQLNQNRDLALTTDFRDVFAEVLVRHLGAQDPSPIFPGFQVSPARFRGFIS